LREVVEQGESTTNIPTVMMQQLAMAGFAALVATATAQVPMCGNVVVPGYGVPNCNTRINAQARVVAANIFNVNPSETSVAAPRTFQRPRAEVLAEYTSQSGQVYTLPRVEDSDTGNVKFDDYDPSSPLHCGMLCDLNDECGGFSWAYGRCWLAASAGDTSGTATFQTRNSWHTYIKSSSALRAPGKVIGAVEASRFPVNSASDMCDPFFTLGEPCTLDAVAGSSTNLVTKFTNDFSGFEKSLTMSNGNTWLGSAPSVFDTSLTSFTNGVGLVLDTQHQPASSGYTFPEADADCGCEYEDYVTSIAVGTASGYGFYEATLQSTADEFVSAFWLQGPQTEINVLKVENGVATVSWFCFADADNQQSGTTVIEGVNLNDKTTATLHYTAEQITVLINGVIKYQVATPQCMQGAQMKPIFSVEVGDFLPSTSTVAAGASFGKMTVSYFRQWTSQYLVHNDADGGLQCVADTIAHPGVSTTGLYKGPVPSGNWRAVCGQRLIGQRRIATQLRTTLNMCGELCNTQPGCVAFFWAREDKGRCRMYNDVVPTPQEDFRNTNPNDHGNVWMVRSSGEAIVSILESCPTVANQDGFSRNCFRSPNAFGTRASIDIDQDGLIDYGCPYDRTQFTTEIEGVEIRYGKACQDKHCATTEGQNVCPLAGSPIGDGAKTYAGDKLPEGYARPGVWDEARDWGNGVGVLGALNVELCVDLCRKECSCKMAAWRSDREQCWLMSNGWSGGDKNHPRHRFKNQGPSSRTPSQAGIQQLTYVAFVKENPVECDRDELRSRGVLSNPV